MDKKFKLDTNGKTESLISLNLLDSIKIINTNIFLRRYKISNFFKGKFFVKRLIKKVFKYKLQKNMIWNNKFWDRIEIVEYKTSINFSKKFKTIDEFEEKIKMISSLKRIKSIYKYKTMISQNFSFDFPLFISGECLNAIGGNIIDEKLYLLDGSRRIIAHLLNGKREINIYLILVIHNA